MLAGRKPKPRQRQEGAEPVGFRQEFRGDFRLETTTVTKKDPKKTKTQTEMENNNSTPPSAKQNRSIQGEDRQRSYNLRQDEMKEPKVNSEQWKRLDGEMRSRGKLAADLDALGFEHKVKEMYAGKKMYAKNLFKEAAAALSVGKEWLKSRHTKKSEVFCKRSGISNCGA